MLGSFYWFAVRCFVHVIIANYHALFWGWVGEFRDEKMRSRWNIRSYTLHPQHAERLRTWKTPKFSVSKLNTYPITVFGDGLKYMVYGYLWGISDFHEWSRCDITQWAILYFISCDETFFRVLRATTCDVFGAMKPSHESKHWPLPSYPIVRTCEKVPLCASTL